MRGGGGGLEGAGGGDKTRRGLLSGPSGSALPSLGRAMAPSLCTGVSVMRATSPRSAAQADFPNPKAGALAIPHTKQTHCRPHRVHPRVFRLSQRKAPMARKSLRV